MHNQENRQPNEKGSHQAMPVPSRHAPQLPTVLSASLGCLFKLDPRSDSSRPDSGSRSAVSQKGSCSPLKPARDTVRQRFRPQKSSRSAKRQATETQATSFTSEHLGRPRPILTFAKTVHAGWFTCQCRSLDVAGGDPVRSRLGYDKSKHNIDFRYREAF